MSRNLLISKSDSPKAKERLLQTADSVIHPLRHTRNECRASIFLTHREDRPYATRFLSSGGILSFPVASRVGSSV